MSTRAKRAKLRESKPKAADLYLRTHFLFKLLRLGLSKPTTNLGIFATPTCRLKAEFLLLAIDCINIKNLYFSPIFSEIAFPSSSSLTQEKNTIDDGTALRICLCIQISREISQISST